MEIRVLNYFLAVVREKSITKAAEKLNLTQPTLSRQIHLLEQELGVKLIERGRKITLTAEGKFLRERAEQLVRLERSTREQLSMRGKEISGQVRINCSDIEASPLLNDIIEKFKAIHPAVSFEISYEVTSQTKHLLNERKIDFALFQEPVDTDSYNFFRLNGINRTWGILMSSDLPFQGDVITKEEARKLILILPERDELRNMIVEWLEADIDSLKKISTYNIHTSSYLVLEKKGYLVTGSIIADFFDPAKFRFVSFYPKLETYTLLVWNKYHPLDRATSSFLEFLKDNS